MKNLDKKRYGKAVAVLVFSFVFIFANMSLAKAGIGDWSGELEKGVSEAKVYDTGAVEEAGGASPAIAKYIGGLLFWAPFFGLLFMARIVIAGYEWMTAAGNSEKIDLAKKGIINATIGLLIFAIVYFLAYFFVKMFAGLAGCQGGFDTIKE